MKAFPTVNWIQQQGQPPNAEGMELRDYFAAKVMPVMLATHGYSSAAKFAYQAADEMMKAREK